MSPSQRQHPVSIWLSNLPDPIASPSTDETRKRKAGAAVSDIDHRHSHLSSPPVSVPEMDPNTITPSRKRQRQGTTPDQPNPLDPESTPRPSDRGGAASSSSARAISDVPAISQSQSSASTRSSRSQSPKKQLMQLRLAGDGLQLRDLDSSTCPDTVSPLLNIMESISNGLDILPYDRRDEIHASAACCPNGETKKWRHSFRPPEDEDQEKLLPGRVPMVDEVQVICELAKECLVQGLDEAGWNMEVHHRMLECVFRRPRPSRSNDEFNFTPCTTARPDQAYLPSRAPIKLVDFCI